MSVEWTVHFNSELVPLTPISRRSGFQYGDFLSQPTEKRGVWMQRSQPGSDSTSIMCPSVISAEMSPACPFELTLHSLRFGDCHHACEGFKAVTCCLPVSSDPSFTLIRCTSEG